ncbi:MAG: hypothetical protein SFY66_04505 [Oculatellaceae cyanobacterium bins.114]|nr:hypothetical protein [Oculatellaceae cyanobacterium bins.114]
MVTTHFLENKLEQEALKSSTIQKIYCPNCGSSAERHYLLTNHMVRTQCSTCDYLLITCSRTGNVIEAYAPGIPAHR